MQWVGRASHVCSARTRVSVSTVVLVSSFVVLNTGPTWEYSVAEVWA
jgi:hypothetical protein